MSSLNGTNSNEAYKVIQALKKDTNTFEIIERLSDFQKYLESLCKQIGNLKPECILQWTFKNTYAEKDYESYAKANVHAAKLSLGRLIPKIEKKGINDVLKRLVSDFICDLKPFIGFFDNDQNYSWLLCNTNSHITNFYYDLSCNIFFNGMPGKHPEERLALATSTPFVIRQSIEYKIKRILGIDYILVNNKLDNRVLEKCFKAIKVNSELYVTKGFSFSVLKLIHTWTHYFIHGGYRPEPWRTETALNYLDSLFYSGKTLNNSMLSRYASIEIDETLLEELMKRTEETIKRESDGSVQIKWLNRPEIAIIRKKA